MAISVKEDLLFATPAQISLKKKQFFRKFRVTGLSSVAPTARGPASLLAVDAVTGFTMPLLGDQYPGYPDYYVSQLTPHCVGVDVYHVLVTYEFPVYADSFLTSFSGSFAEEPTFFDASGNPAIVEYTPAGSTAAIKKPAQLKKRKLHATLSFHFLEQQNPEQLTLAYAGAVNSNSWRGQAARTWLCLPITGSSQDGIWYKNAYAFAFNPSTWDEYAVFKRTDGSVPADIAQLVTDGSTYSGNGWGRFIVDRQEDFYVCFPNIQ